MKILSSTRAITKKKKIKLQCRTLSNPLYLKKTLASLILKEILNKKIQATYYPLDVPLYVKKVQFQLFTLVNKILETVYKNNIHDRINEMKNH